MEIIKNPNKSEWASILKRPTQSFQDLENQAKQIFKDVLNNGDKAILKYAKLFDKFDNQAFTVLQEEIKASEENVSEDLKSAIQNAYEAIYKFHKAQLQPDLPIVETKKGVFCWQKKKAIQKVGLYIPGGSAPLFSTVLMLAIPAQIAGCEDIVLCTPPSKDNKIDPAILYTAQLCGVTQIFKVGGIQAIAGMTFGTESIPKVYKIFGPGNQYVTIAKQIATTYDIAIDMPAGPSELLVYANQTSVPEFVAADLLSQAEHGEDSQVILVADNLETINQVKTELNLQINSLPRKEIAKKAIANSKFILMKNLDSAFELINFYAPEHLIIATDQADEFSEKVINAGSVFLGNLTPESAGDYASGTNHTLPTNAFAKQYSGVNLDAFMKTLTYQKLDENGVKSIGKTVEMMAEAEGLTAHKNAMRLRLNALKLI
ncbi:MAG: histidinol dehydrogenase [Psychroflexus halocasei]|uniref:histidinol dehydrogenase n=1 Tax=Psychroflexus sp. S27 TaxID=1982757 RepID=UPI000C29AFD5|nr:histidinol dehydrogenase [Psychroflexus sp. S27]PJX28587.1 histidinol dehydrogenase [Psychroflexus sp. S27]